MGAENNIFGKGNKSEYLPLLRVGSICFSRRKWAINILLLWEIGGQLILSGWIADKISCLSVRDCVFSVGGGREHLRKMRKEGKKLDRAEGSRVDYRLCHMFMSRISFLSHYWLVAVVALFFSSSQYRKEIKRTVRCQVVTPRCSFMKLQWSFLLFTHRSNGMSVMAILYAGMQMHSCCNVNGCLDAAALRVQKFWEGKFYNTKFSTFNIRGFECSNEF